MSSGAVGAVSTELFSELRSLMQSQNAWSIWDRIDARNEKHGWARWDAGDLNSHPIVTAARPRQLARVLQLGLRGFDLLAPIPVHTISRMPKKVIPSGFYHVGLAHLLREEAPSQHNWSGSRAVRIAEEAVKIKVPAEHACWANPYPHHGAPWKSPEPLKAPPSCGHHTIRVGMLVLRTGLRHNRKDLVAEGVSAAKALLNYHRWQEYADGSWTVSYYPWTEDETINTVTETATLFSEIPAELRPNECQAKIEGVVRMAIREQREDGAWAYHTELHYARIPGFLAIDSHHTGQVIQSLARIIDAHVLPEDLEQDLRVSVAKGLHYCLKNLFLEDGTGLLFSNHDGGPAHIVGYSEVLGGVLWADRAGCLDFPTHYPTAEQGKMASWTSAQAQELRDLVQTRTPRILAKALAHWDPKTDDVACFFRKNGTPYNIQSLRWGSGPLLEAISTAALMAQA